LSVKLFAMTCGRLSGDLGYLMEGGEGRADLPIPAYLIEHPKGTVLFDTGMQLPA
jgi:N-acyl homoserine lactone hydrolase